MKRPFTRRSFLERTGLFTASALAASAASELLADAAAHSAADAVMARLVQGNARYRQGKTIHGDRTARRDEVASGQHPFAMILSCADSRVPPELIFDQTLGDLFVVRVAGNYAETGGIGSFEYAFEHFHSPVLLVLGHTACGAVHATVDALKNPKGAIPGDIAAIVNAIAPSVRKVSGKPGDVYANAIVQNARDNAARLKAQPPILSNGVAQGKLRVVSAVYDLKSGSIAIS